MLASGGTCTGATTPTKPAPPCCDLPRRQRAHGHQGQVDGQRGAGINEHLERHGIQPIETDLGEYIIQLRHELPSHIIAPAFHFNRDDWEREFRKAHTDLPADRVFAERRDILTEARAGCASGFIAADVGITGANFLIAETGSSVIVTNEGNGDLTQTLPRVHVVIATIEKIVPTVEDALSLLRVLARSATGQEFSVYTTFSTGPRRWAIWTGRRNTTWWWWTTAAPRCWAANSSRCCAASVAPRV